MGWGGRGKDNKNCIQALFSPENKDITQKLSASISCNWCFIGLKFFSYMISFS